MSILLFDWNTFWTKALEIGKTIGLKLLEVIGIFILGYIAIKIVIKVLRKIFEKSKMPKVTYKFVLSFVKFCLYLLLVIILCQVVGIPITGFVAVLSAAGLALSLAIQDSLSNFANGVVIASTRPFKEGDYISIGDTEGTVVEIKMLHTIINTVDNKQVNIPNSKVVGSELVNYSANPTRKVVFSFAVDYATDIDSAKKIILNVISNCNKVLLDPAPFCALKTMDDSCLTLTANCWVLNGDYWTVYYEILDSVFNELKRNNISIPYNQLEVRLRNDNVVMPFRNEALKPRDEEKAVKLVRNEDDDVFEKMFKSIKKKSTKKESSKPAKKDKKTKK